MKSIFPRAAVSGQLSKIDEAQSHPEQIIPIQPASVTRRLELMRDKIYSDENSVMVLEGLRKAGLEMAVGA